jgi:hypothetical protein
VADTARPDDAADPAASAPVDAPAAAPDARPTLDESLAEFERATAQPAAPSEPAANYDEIDKLLDELSKPGGAPLDGSPLFGQQVSDAQQQVQREAEQFSALQNENAQLKSRLQFEADQKDFGALTSEVQSKLPSNLPDDFAVTALKSMAVDRPELVLAFDTRHLDRRAVAAELRQVEAALFWQQRNPNAADPGYAAQLQQYRGQLNVALHGREILNRAVREVVQRGQAHRPIDETATADHDAVVFAMRGAGGKAPVEAPPNFANMSDRELKKYTREHYGF